MSEQVMQKEQATPKTIYLKDYKVPPFLIDEIALEFDLNDDVTLVKSRLEVKRNPHSDEHPLHLVLQGEELQLESIFLNQTRLEPSAYDVTSHDLSIFNVTDHFTLEITTKIYPQQNKALTGLYCSNQKYCTQCEAEGFRRITYFLDHPDVLARYKTTIKADLKRYPYLLSNGNLIASGLLENERHFATWEDPFKKPSYLFALVAGDFAVVTDTFKTQSGRVITLKFYVEKNFEDQIAHAIESLKVAMRWDEVTFGLEYDLDIYMIVAINDFNMGAMENKGLNIFNTSCILAKPSTGTDDDYIHVFKVVGHEYFHNWTGNRITCRDWFQLSLKEGLTVFREQLFSEDNISQGVIRIRDVNELRETQFVEDAGPLAHSVRPDSYIEINNFYTATVYNKGAEVLRMLRNILGTQLFRKGMDLYFKRHDGQAVTLEDFVKVMEDVSHKDLSQFRLWYQQAGTPIVNVVDDYDASSQTYRLTFTQSCPATPNQPEKKAMLIPICVGLLDPAGHELPLHLNEATQEDEKVLLLTKSSQTFQFDHVPVKPVPSLLRTFSAPVILNYDFSDANLIFLLKHDTDAFNRWEALQKYAVKTILNLVRDYQQDKLLEVPPPFVEAFKFLLETATNDKLFIARMLMLPSEQYLSEQMDVIDVEAIHHVRELIIHELANQLQPIFLNLYQQCHVPTRPYQFKIADIGERQLKNRCLTYLLEIHEHLELALQQFSQSLGHNMTDTQAALRGIANTNSAHRERVLQEFYQFFIEDPLVIDKWFSIQATSKLPDTLQQVKKLTRHPAFDLKNPNKVYALIGGFSRLNPINFHHKDGEAYAFFRDIVQQLDEFNPQIAARMVRALTTWKRYDKERQSLMKKQLELLLSRKTSPDLYEIVSKSLEF